MLPNTTEGWRDTDTVAISKPTQGGRIGYSKNLWANGKECHGANYYLFEEDRNRTVIREKSKC